MVYPSHGAKQQCRSSEQHSQLKAGLPREAFTWEEQDKHLQEDLSQKCQRLPRVELLLLSVGEKKSASALGEIKKLYQQHTH